MTRPLKLVRNIGIGLGAFIVVLVIAGLILVQTNWFREYVRGKIVSATADGTGGRVEVGSFAFDVRRFQADVNGLVIHGKEPADAAPYIRVQHVRLNIRLF